jgi:hypothetical protein
MPQVARVAADVRPTDMAQAGDDREALAKGRGGERDQGGEKLVATSRPALRVRAQLISDEGVEPQLMESAPT